MTVLGEFYFEQKCVLNISSNNKLSEKKSRLFSQLVQNMAVDPGQVSSIPLIGFVHGRGRLATKIGLCMHIPSVIFLYQGN